MTRLLLVGIFLEVGAVLLVVPWTMYWEENYFATAIPFLHSLITNNFFRGAVSGLGVLNLLAGIVELTTLFLAGRSDQAPSVPPVPSATED
ncbi:MAG TPA: hypothetical protein VFV95_17495 [Vicinamibacterales bacterium]|nr:hypothetical protein [Vicinamibacterales bacterium]